MQNLDIYKDCHQIHKKRAKKNPNGNHEYAIDPDQGGPIEPFGVTCDFKTNKNIGITVVCNIFAVTWQWSSFYHSCMCTILSLPMGQVFDKFYNLYFNHKINNV